jgi:phage tail protein X
MGQVFRPQGNLYASVQAVVEALADIGIAAVTDPRNAHPNSVLVELPTVDSYTYNVSDIRLVVRCLAPPPGNEDSANYLMTLADKITNSEIAVVSSRPGFATYGQQEMPTYDLTVAVAVKRN